MLTTLRRAWLRTQIAMVQIETAQAEQAERDLPRHLEHLAQRETALRVKLTALSPLRVVNAELRGDPPALSAERPSSNDVL